MRHRVRGRKLGRNASHRKAMFRNMANSLIRSVHVDEDDPNAPRVAGRIVTTEAKAKELRPFVEKLITIARKAQEYAQDADQYATDAAPDSNEWQSWRNSEQWQKWAQATAPAVAMRRRAYNMLRDHEAVDILFDELAERFQDRPGGYTRVVRLPAVRLGDGGTQALIEFVGERDRKRTRRKAAPVVTESSETPTTEAAVDESAASEDDTAPASDASAESAESPENSAADESTAEGDEATEKES